MGCRSNGSSELWAVGIKTRTRANRIVSDEPKYVLWGSHRLYLYETVLLKNLSTRAYSFNKK